MLDAVFKMLGRSDALSKSEYDRSMKRNSFSKWLPWLMYNNDSGAFLTTDNAITHMWECVPLVYCGFSQVSALESLLNQEFPEGSVIQVSLYSDDHIKPILDAYKKNKTKGDEVGRRSAYEYTKFLEEGAAGLAKINGIPVRNFRVFISIKTYENINDDVINIVHETLIQAGLSPKKMNQLDLEVLMQRFFNGNSWSDKKRSDTADNVSEGMIRANIIEADTPIDFRHRFPQIGKRFAACMTIKDLPDDINAMDTNQCFGGVMGMQDDANQLNFPFLYTLNIVYDRSIDNEVSHKASLTMGQKAIGNFAYSIGLRVREFSKVLGDLAKNKRYLKIIPVLWVFGDSRKQVSKRASRAVTVWEKRNFKLQQETILNKVLLIAALPGGLYNFRDNINTIDRHYYASTSGVARMLPVQGDYQGNGSPVMLLVGRKGQLIGLDVYAEGSNNHNLLVGAESGAGKSFILNTMLSDYADAGEKVRVVDIGYSYKKLCYTKGGKFIDLGDPNEQHCINPFWFNANDAEDMKYNLEAAINVVAEMVYSASGSHMRESEWTLLKMATDHVVVNGLYLNAVTEIRNWLRDYDIHEKDSLDYIKEMSRVAREMAFNLRDFSVEGKWGHYFNGKATLNIADDDFVVVELETLKSQRELFSVVVMQVMNAITQDLYLSDRMSRRFILFEEAPALLRKSGHTDLTRLAAMIEEGYRRARKYGGSFGVVMQSLLDLKLMGDTGQVIMDNAAYKFMLQSQSFSKAAEEKIVSLSGFALELAESVKNNKPKYSEILFETPQGLGVGRLVVDSWRYWVNTTSADEVGRFEALLKEGKTPYEAIAELSGMGVEYGDET